MKEPITKPWYKSLILWLGLVPFVFILWLIPNSLHQNNVIRIYHGEPKMHAMSFALANGYFYTIHGTQKELRFKYYKTYDYYKLSQGGLAFEEFPPPFKVTPFDQPNEYGWFYLIPIWCFATAYLALWILVLGLWQWRKWKLVKKQEATANGR